MGALSLYEFLDRNRAEILGLSRDKLADRITPTPTDIELDNGLPLFLDQLIEVLQSEKVDGTSGQENVSASAKLHGGELLRMGLTVGQVVQDYGSICQSVTELAHKRGVSISAEEFQTFNQCLDTATAKAVTEYELQRDVAEDAAGAAHLGSLAHEMRNLLNTAMLTFAALTRGNVGVNGSTGAVLGRSLQRMRVLIDRTLAEARIDAGIHKPHRVSIAALLKEIEIVALIEAKSRDIQLSIEAVPFDLVVDGDQQILAAAVANLVQNAFKFTRPQGHIRIRAHTVNKRVLIDVRDECGGLPAGGATDLFRPFEQRGLDQTGMGLGLAISLKGVRANGGAIHVRDLPGEGCVFTVDLPQASPAPNLAAGVV